MNPSRILSFAILVLFSATMSFAQQKKEPGLIYPSTPATKEKEKAKPESPKKTEDAKPENENIKEGTESIKVQKGYGVTVVQNPAEFPGGEEGLATYASKSMKYPKQSKVNGVEGKVFIGFKITKNGKVTNARVVTSVNEEIDAEALRAVQQMPAWKPASINGTPADMEYIIPINFILPKAKRS